MKILFNTALDDQRARLVDTAQSRARLIETIAEHELTYAGHITAKSHGNPAEATLEIIRISHSRFQGFGSTGEFTLAREADSMIVFLLRHRHFDMDHPEPVPLNSKFAEPMRRALAGKSGTVIGLDYRGEMVMAAYEPVGILDLGIVAKIDLTEVRAPYLRASIIGGLLTIVLVFIGTVLFFGVTNPILSKVEESEKKYRLLVEMMNEGVGMMNSSQVFTYVNTKMCELLRYSSEEIIGRSVFDFFDKANLDIFKKQLSLRESGGRESYQLAWTRSDGVQIQTMISPRAIYDEKGKFQGSIGVIADITPQVKAEKEIRESERKYKSLFKSMSNGFAYHRIVTDDSGRPADYIFLEINDAFSKQSGLPNDIIGKKVTEVVPDIADAEPDLITAYGKVALTGDPFTSDFYFKPQDRWYSVLAYSPKKGYFAVIFTDISDRKWDEMKLREYSEKLEEMVEERTRQLETAQEKLIRQEKLAVLGQLAGGVGHELRNPLGAMKNAVYFLNMVLANPQEKVLQSLGILEREIEVSERIISSLLGYAKPQPASKQKTEISKLLGSVLVRIGLPEKVILEFEESKDHPFIEADPDQLKHAFRNIIVNAVQAMPEGGRLKIAVSSVGGSLNIDISDTGDGMSEEIRKMIFEPLFTTKAKGMGLGLAITKTLIEGNGGRIEAFIEEGSGSRFSVSFPLGDEDI